MRYLILLLTSCTITYPTSTEWVIADKIYEDSTTLYYAVPSSCKSNYAVNPTWFADTVDYQIGDTVRLR